jgi:syndetin
VVRGVVLMRPGLEERVRRAHSLPEIVRLLPPDLFRTCLARVPPNPKP